MIRGLTCYRCRKSITPAEAVWPSYAPFIGERYAQGSKLSLTTCFCFDCNNKAFERIVHKREETSLQWQK